MQTTPTLTNTPLASGRGPTWAVVPLKSPERAKSRLGGVLSPTQRRTLFFALARRMLASLVATRGVDGIMVVTPSGEVDALARDYGARVLRQPDEPGTAGAFAAAVEATATLGLRRLLMISGDLPLVSTSALQRLLELPAPARSVVLVPDARKIGTNALLCAPPDVVAPCFGEASFARHLELARCLQVQAQIHDCEALALDIDVPEDLTRLAATLRARDRSPLQPAAASVPLFSLQAIDAGGLHVPN